MQETTVTHASPTKIPVFHHVGVQTADLDNCVAWYRDFFGSRQAWTLTEFSDLTLSRLPGITRLTEMVIGHVRIHLMERAPAAPGQETPTPSGLGAGFQHVCMRVESSEELVGWRRHWVELFDSRRYVFALHDPPTDIVRDADGVESFYAFDVNGLEYEFTYIPDGRGR